MYPYVFHSTVELTLFSRKHKHKKDENKIG